MTDSEYSSIDTRAWLVWLAGMLIVALLTFNPWLQLLTIGIVLLLWHSDAEKTSYLRLSVLLRVAAFALLIGAIFNVLTVHYGSVILLRLPESLPIIGGALTLESLLYGICNALRLISLLFTFALFSRVINYAELLRLAPAAVSELGLMLSISITLIPFTLRSIREIREAQQLRGHQGSGIRNLVPLFAPLVANGMEHALALAESLEARGYGAARSLRHIRRGQRWLLFGGVSAVILFMITAFFTLPTPAVLAAWGVVGAVLWWGLRLLSIGAGRTRVRRGHWRIEETLVVIGVGFAVIVLISASPSLTVYDPYQLITLGLPSFSPWLGMALLGFAVPGLFLRVSAAPVSMERQAHDPA